jgi:4-carboxymuconolactone decarboxylase
MSSNSVGHLSDPAGEATAHDPQAYIDEMARQRGYVLSYHKTMAGADFPVLQAANALVNAVYTKQRRLSRKTKELLFILSLTILRAEPHHIESHIRVALDEGAAPEEILEALEIALPEAGVVAFQLGLASWRAVVQPEELEPTVTAYGAHGDGAAGATRGPDQAAASGE